ncbi:hypothetical protein, partial [uncultured Xanthomonas sp.]|uniref:hypothetical protein n=1 Tax=uncultured Xanthomonas sp. TaxID=152831 RepID=UPI0025E83427
MHEHEGARLRSAASGLIASDHVRDASRMPALRLRASTSGVFAHAAFCRNGFSRDRLSRESRSRLKPLLQKKTGGFRTVVPR